MATAVGRPYARDTGETDRPDIWIGLLGGFELTYNGNPEKLPVSSQRLVAFLALQSRALQRVYVAGILWPDSTEEHASASLRSALWRLRRPRYSIVEASATHLRLKPSVRVDFAEAAAQANRILTRAGSIDEADVEVFAGARELLPDHYDEWVQIERERFRQLRMHALEALSDSLVDAGRHSAAVRAALAAVDGEPLRESAQRALIRAHLACGNPSEAVRQYKRFERLLRSELGLVPSDAIRSLLPVALA